MKPLTVILIIAAIAAAFWMLRRRRAQGFTLKEFVRKPRLRRQHDKTRAQDAEVVEFLKRQPPETLIRGLLDTRFAALAQKAICSDRPDTVPHLIAALGDPAFRGQSKQEIKEARDFFNQRLRPILLVLRCLEDYPREEAVAALADLAGDQDEDIRGRVALVLASIGTESTIGPLQLLLADEDDYVRSYAMAGVLRALDANRATMEFRAAAFDAIAPHAFRRDATVSGDAPRCLLALDRHRAIAFLTHRDRLAASADGLHYVLRALREESIRVDVEQLEGLARTLEPIVETHPNDYALGETLRLFAGVDPVGAREWVERSLRSPAKKVREDAAEALAQLEGCQDPYDFAFELMNTHEWGELSRPQRNLMAARMLIDQVNNGGFTQYFFNKPDETWRDALAGFEVMGAHETLRLSRCAIDLFGEAGPANDQDQRCAQLAAIFDRDENAFRDLDDEFYMDGDDREVLLLRYIAENAEHFRP